MENKLHYRTLWLGIGWAYIGFIFFVSLMPQPPMLHVTYFDKLSHFTAYAVAMAWFIQLYSNQLTRIYYALAFVCMGIGIEFLQGLSGQRMFEYADMLANSLGVICALFMVNGVSARMLWHIEQRLIRQA